MNVRTRITAIAVTVAVIVPAIVIWFAQIGAAQEKAQQRPTIRYAYFKAFDPTFIALSRGYFRQEGVNVVLTGNFPSGPASVQGAALDQVDAGLCAVTGLITARAANVKVKAIADSQTEFRNAPLQRFYVREDSGIRGVQDLKGKRIAVNSMTGSFRFAALVALHKAGLQSDDVRWIIVPQPNQEQALRQGDVDAVGLIDPYNTKLVESGGVKLIFNAVDSMGQRHVSLIFFRNQMISSSPKAVRAFVRAYRHAITWYYANPKRGAQIVERYIQVPSKYAVKHRYTPRARVNFSDIQFWLGFMRQEGSLKDDARLKPSDIATRQFTGK